jgi:ribose transport system permease protein
MAIGMTFVIVCGEIDLSVGSLASFAGMIVAMLYERDVPTFVAPLIVLAMGALVGAVSGPLVTKIRIPSFLVLSGCCRSFPAWR